MRAETFMVSLFLTFYAKIYVREVFRYWSSVKVLVAECFQNWSSSKVNVYKIFKNWLSIKIYVQKIWKFPIHKCLWPWNNKVVFKFLIFHHSLKLLFHLLVCLSIYNKSGWCWFKKYVKEIIFIFCKNAKIYQFLNILWSENLNNKKSVTI